MGLFLYNVFLFFLRAGIGIAALWNPKARLWIQGRRNWQQQIINWKKNNLLSQVVWMHCASLGEFEQGRPVIEKIKLQYPDCKIIISFFSPSGFQVRKNYPEADMVCYLPVDSKKNAALFIDTLKPSLVIWVKYEYWYYFLQQLHQANIPVLLISAIFRHGQPFFKWYGEIWKKMLSFFRIIFVQNPQCLALLSSIKNISTPELAGDTRFDRVVDFAENNIQTIKIVKDFCADMPVIVAGSTWPEDEKLLLHYANANPGIKFIIAPHEIGTTHLHEIKKAFHNSAFYSSLQHHTDLASSLHVLIIDNIGMLAGLYAYATLTYIGGGFGEDGIHNTLEAAVYGKPVVFGREYEKFAEATGLVACGAAFSVSNALQLEACFNQLLSDESMLQKSSSAAKKYVYAKQGATQKILTYIAENRLLTN